MKIRSWMKAPAVLIIGAGLTFVMPAAAAVGASSPPSTAVHITASKVSLLAGGLAIQVPIRYVCPAGASPQLSVRVSAVSHRAIITAFAGFQGKTCTGTVQHVSAILAVQGERFKPGPALGEASLFECSFFCNSTTDAKALTLT